MVSAVMPVHTNRTSRRRFCLLANCRHLYRPRRSALTRPKNRTARKRPAKTTATMPKSITTSRQASPARRLVVMMAVLGLVIVGTAGAFAYRNMFGGAVFAGLPPIIKASITPNKILPKNGDAQADNSAQSSTSAQANSDKLVSHEEQPVNMEPPKVGSRVVATIPIGAGQMPPPLVTPAPAARSGSAPSYSTASAGTALDTPPDGGQPAPSPMPTTAAPRRPLRHRQQLRPSPKKFTQSSSTPTSPAPRLRRARGASTAAAPAPRAPLQAKASASASAPVGAECTIVDHARCRRRGGRVGAARVLAAAAAAPVALASAEPAETVAASAPSGGRYAVQVTSQHSEADAKASFKELRAKFPNQLSGREPIIRRADLGAKGVYYRAMVGPYASMAEAAGVCSSIKAAGGNCLVQRN